MVNMFNPDDIFSRLLKVRIYILDATANTISDHVGTYRLSQWRSRREHVRIHSGPTSLSRSR